MNIFSYVYCVYIYIDREREREKLDIHILINNWNLGCNNQETLGFGSSSERNTGI